jgi:hypothetical protein
LPTAYTPSIYTNTTQCVGTSAGAAVAAGWLFAVVAVVAVVVVGVSM